MGKYRIEPIVDYEPPVSRQLAQWYQGLTYDQVPGDVKVKVKEFVLDVVGCMLGAYEEEAARIGREVASVLSGPSEATIVGSGEKVGVASAALANGIQAHTLDFDDDHREGTMHPSVSVIPAALAVAEKEGLSGRDFLTAAVCGYETMIRAGAAFLGKTYYAGWHPTGTCGVFGAAAAAAKLWRLNEDQMVHTLGLALSCASGTNEYILDGAWAKRFHPGHAGMDGIISAMLAQKGFTGPSRPFEGPWGFLACYNYNGIIDPERLLRGIGKHYDIATNSIKYHMGGRFGATSADAMADIVEKNDIDPDEVEEIVVGACDFTMIAHFGYYSDKKTIKYRPKTTEQAMFSLPYTIACLLLFRKIGPEQYKPELLTDSRVISVMDKVRGVVDQEAESVYPKHYMARVTVREKSGKTYESVMKYPKGDPENPVTREELLEKYFTLATRVLSEERARTISEMLLNLENVGNMGKITALLQPGG